MPRQSSKILDKEASAALANEIRLAKEKLKVLKTGLKMAKADFTVATREVGKQEKVIAKLTQRKQASVEAKRAARS